MPSIGAPLRKWTTFLLLLCSIPTLGQPTNETTSTESPVVASSTTKIPSIPPPASRASGASYHDIACPFRTINYITHTLPQQCLKTSWSAPVQDALTASLATEEGALPIPSVIVPWAVEGIGSTLESVQQDASLTAEARSNSQETAPSETAVSVSAIGPQGEVEAEGDSPLDNANFLSFEEWKKKNLERAGQSPENVGQGRTTSSESKGRRRPVNINALDSLGEEAEIELDFSGFGNAEESNGGIARSPSGSQTGEITKAAEGEDNAAPSSWALSKDAGKTCKERFNYASFDCAATVLKTNPQAKSSSAVLVENKDSYMLNECSAQNKFVIVELCDDILVDTIVLANYEFFSSMFRHFRVSVSDRYPVKLDRWRTLATFEARNSRDIQAFLVSEPQIWARYLRIEFLSNYGNEFYCPISLLRVHGTTMMEQFRREEEEARGEEDFGEPLDPEGEPAKTPVSVPEGIETTSNKEVSVEPAENSDTISVPPEQNTMVDVEFPKTIEQYVSTATQPSDSHRSHKGPREAVNSRISSPELEDPAATSETSDLAKSPPSTLSGKNGAGATRDVAVAQSNITQTSKSSSAVSSSPLQASTTENKTQNPSAPDQDGQMAHKSSTNDTTGSSSGTPTAKAASNSTASGTQSQSQARGSSQTQSNPATPTTQESFFKSIHKRLQQLEANSTLSLQYIEEQSRILRDAFMKVEKRQLSKTEKFLEHLNNTVMQELKSYRNMYDQLWQSTILELEGMKERQKAEVGEIGARLSLVADELVWQKRMAVVQSTLLLLCLGLVLFVRSGSLGPQMDMPIVQQLGSKASRFFDTPPGSPAHLGGIRRRRTFRSMWRSDTSAGLSERSAHLSENAISDADTDGRRSPRIDKSPLTPNTPGFTLDHDQEPGLSPARTNSVEHDVAGDIDTGLLTPTEETEASLNDQAQRLEALATQSGPATPRGSRDSRPSWEEVDRAVDLLRAEKLGLGKALGEEHEREKRMKRSPLRRTESYDGAVDDSPEDDGAESLFVAG
ncbi:hypothetical protein CC78DRAFT_619624 [Lojkania enalia]|uniref:SUN domain-containing protein n=1 Tax=Lojkania enalia TaxID=147567 RepID=A0A9P4K1E2_9PLEO|nr:hypothetical protein CC78DRAFT_619624 [Didymosphaeria enalia]